MPRVLNLQSKWLPRARICLHFSTDYLFFLWAQAFLFQSDCRGRCFKTVAILFLRCGYVSVLCQFISTQNPSPSCEPQAIIPPRVFRCLLPSTFLFKVLLQDYLTDTLSRELWLHFFSLLLNEILYIYIIYIFYI